MDLFNDLSELHEAQMTVNLRELIMQNQISNMRTELKKEVDTTLTRQNNAFKNELKNELTNDTKNMMSNFLFQNGYCRFFLRVRVPSLEQHRFANPESGGIWIMESKKWIVFRLLLRVYAGSPSFSMSRKLTNIVGVVVERSGWEYVSLVVLRENSQEMQWSHSVGLNHGFDVVKEFGDIDRIKTAQEVRVINFMLEDKEMTRICDISSVRLEQ
ncbi:hypothetical protein Tco_0606739 [Tanacetum coccineum]